MAGASDTNGSPAIAGAAGCGRCRRYLDDEGMPDWGRNVVYT